MHSQWSSGTHRSYLPSSIFSVCLRTHRLEWDQNQSCYRTWQRNTHTRIRQILRWLLIFLFLFVLTNTNLLAVLFHMETFINEFTSIVCMVSHLWSWTAPRNRPFEKIDSGSMSSQVALCISFCPNSLRLWDKHAPNRKARSTVRLSEVREYAMIL